MQNDAIYVANLKDHPELVRIVAKWLWKEWYLWQGKSLSYVIYKIEHSMTDAIPQTFVAIRNGVPIGTAALLNHDLNSRPDLGPWLGSLFVPKKFRGLGISRMLRDSRIEEAKRLGYEKVYLISDYKKQFYEAKGWNFLGEMPGNVSRTTQVFELKLK
ncbi:MAG: family N-acetyltransferase [Patescibacteria group bacterium]|nr:family N-acetyltransferase [Patescibacteria group bacterium]